MIIQTSIERYRFPNRFDLSMCVHCTHYLWRQGGPRCLQERYRQYHGMLSTAPMRHYCQSHCVVNWHWLTVLPFLWNKTGLSLSETSNRLGYSGIIHTRKQGADIICTQASRNCRPWADHYYVITISTDSRKYEYIGVLQMPNAAWLYQGLYNL